MLGMAIGSKKLKLEAVTTANIVTSRRGLKGRSRLCFESEDREGGREGRGKGPSTQNIQMLPSILFPSNEGMEK